MPDDSMTIKYYGDGDWGLGKEAEKMTQFLDTFDEKRSDYTLNEILSMYNMTRFMDKNVWLKRLSDRDIEHYESLRGALERQMRRFFDEVTEENAREKLDDVDQKLNDDLLSLVLKYNLPGRIATPTLLKALKMNGAGMHFMLHDAKFMKLYEDEIKAELLANEWHDEYVIRGMFCASDREHLYLPKMSGQELEMIINRYLDNEHANPSFVGLIAENARVASAKTRLKAKRLDKQLTEKLLETSPTKLDFGFWVQYAVNQEEPLKATQDGTDFKLSYSKDFLDALTSGEDIANFCINGLWLAAENSVLDFPAYRSEATTLTFILEQIGKDAYPATSPFQMKVGIMVMSVDTLERYLERNGHGIEEGIEWFFSQYLGERYGAEGFHYGASTSKKFAEKTAHVLLAFDAILKQFQCFVEEGKVDHELVELSSNAPAFAEVKSLCCPKYACVNNASDEMRRIMFLRFSDQAQYLRDEAESVKWLVEKGIFEQAEEGTRPSAAAAALLRALNEHEAIVVSYCSDDEKGLLEQWEKEGWIEYSDTLLTPAEIDFYDYVLNNKRFTNNLALRNRYAHGARIVQNEEKARRDYAMALMLMVGLMIKIRGEFEMIHSVL